MLLSGGGRGTLYHHVRRMSQDSTSIINEVPKYVTHTKKRFAILFGYNGTGYFGLQVNPGVETVESELERAIMTTGVCKSTNSGDFLKHGWNRAARTDKGVHAMGQVVSLKMGLNDDTKENVDMFVKNLNAALPKDIRVYTALRVSKMFNSKTQCSGRLYEYLVPTSMFRPNPELWEKTKEFFKDGRPETAIPSRLSGEHKTELFLMPDPNEEEIAAQGDAWFDKNQPTDDYVFSSETLKRFNEMLALYCGTHYFHNFTSRVGYNDPSAQRFIVSCAATEPFVIDDVEFVMVKLEGQSFMLNQIRKMVALAVEVVRRGLGGDMIQRALQPEYMQIPMIPGEGLALRACLYTMYAKKQRQKLQKAETMISFEEEPIRSQVDAFHSEVIVPIIAKQEKENHVFSRWSRELDRMKFPLEPSGELRSFEHEKRKRDEGKKNYRLMKKTFNRNDQEGQPSVTEE